MYEGTVKFWLPDRGFRFIQRHDGQPDVFCHVSGIVGQSSDILPEGVRVSFDIEASKRTGKPVAVNVRVI